MSEEQKKPEEAAVAAQPAAAPTAEEQKKSSLDEAKAIITEAQIASDCLEPETIRQAEHLLQGSSTKTMPMYDSDSEIIHDIIHLIYG